MMLPILFYICFGMLNAGEDGTDDLMVHALGFYNQVVIGMENTGS